MADTLEIFGIEYTNVAGIIATDDNGDELTYTQDSGFVINLDIDDITGYWTPDKTSAEIEDAASAGKELLLMFDSSGNHYASWHYFMGTFSYAIARLNLTSYGTMGYVIEHYTYYDDIVNLAYTSEYPEIENQNKTVTPTTSQQTITADADYTGLGTVTVNAMPSGSATPASSISATGASVSTSTNTLTLSKSVSNTPQVSAGYVSSGTAGNSSVSLTASVTTQAAQTIYPSTSDQSISASRYLTGAQTIKAVTTSNLTAANIKNGVTVTVGDSSNASRVASVTGTYTGDGGSSMNWQAYLGNDSRTANSYGATAVTLTVAKTGTYTVSWTAWRSSSSGTMGTNLHVNNTTGTNQQTFTSTYGQRIELTNQHYNEDDVLTLYATSGSTTRSIIVANLIIKQTA